MPLKSKPPVDSTLKHPPYREIFAKAFGRELTHEPPSTYLVHHQVHKTYNVLLSAQDELLRPYGLTTSKYRLMMWLLACERTDYTEGLLPSTLSKFHSVAANTGSALISGLEGQGLVERRKHATDNRKALIYLTAQGHALLETVRPLFDEFSQNLVEALSEEERKVLINLLEKLASSIQARECL
jgi:DNA-binding MarR family transcriptional regulator